MPVYNHYSFVIKKDARPAFPMDMQEAGIQKHPNPKFGLKRWVSAAMPSGFRPLKLGGFLGGWVFRN